MIGISPCTIDLKQLTQMVEKQMCEVGHLEPDQFPLTMRDVIRSGRKCGIYFCLHGPRSVKLTAICDFQSKSVMYYGVDGIRVEKMELPRLASSLMAQAA
ncbi:MAG: hypothetical protein AAF989_15875 [Planctomycetota bacterium]